MKVKAMNEHMMRLRAMLHPQQQQWVLSLYDVLTIGWAVDEIERLQQELAERDEQHRRVMESPCPEEVHCTCVPILRAEIERLEAENQKLREFAEAVSVHPDIPYALEEYARDVRGEVSDE